MPIASHVNLVDLDLPLGRRVGVFGAGGKSSLARAIAKKSDLTFIELDSIQHLPGWGVRPGEEVRQIVLEQIESCAQGWVTDHNSRSVRQEILARADSVVVLELPFHNVFWRRVKRSVLRAWRKEVVCNGNVETFRQHFASRDSAILEIWNRRKRYSRIGETISLAARSGVNFYYIQSARQLDRFYDLHGLVRK